MSRTHNTHFLSLNAKTMKIKQMEVLKRLQIDTNFTDCTIVVNCVEFKCHKIILSAGSEYFQRLFLDEYKKWLFPVIPLPNVTPVIFKIFREYIYSYDSSILQKYDMQTVSTMFKCGYTWLAPFLIVDCANALVERAEKMSAADLTVLFKFGHEYQNEILMNGISRIFQSKSYSFRINNNNSLFMLSEDTFKKFISLYPEENRQEIAESYIKFNRFAEVKTISVNVKEEEDSE